MKFGAIFFWQFFLLISICTACSCGNQKIQHTHIPNNLNSSWRSDTTKITVRTSPGFMQFEFTEGEGQIYLQLNDSVAQGSIGLASFHNAPIIKNTGDPHRNGIAYIVRCGFIGKIFAHDPLAQKEVSIELGPLVEGQMKSGLRYTEGGAKYPMAGFILRPDLNEVYRN